MKKRRCPQSNLDCYEARCPLDDQHFCDELDRWLYTGREAASVDWSKGGKPDKGASERRTLEKCGIYVLFDDPELVQEFWAHGGMTRQVCEMLKKGWRRWKAGKDEKKG